MFVNYMSREFCIKLVYYGPSGAGVSTNLDRIHPDRNAPVRGIALGLHEEGAPFEYTFPGLGRIRGFGTRGYFYERLPQALVPGQGVEKLIAGADGVAFVADSRAERLADNVAAAELLRGALALAPVEKAGRPIVLQLNRRDDPSALPVAELVDAMGLGPTDVVEAVAITGQGVRPTLVGVLKPLLVGLKALPPPP